MKPSGSHEWGEPVPSGTSGVRLRHCKVCNKVFTVRTVDEPCRGKSSPLSPELVRAARAEIRELALSADTGGLLMELLDWDDLTGILPNPNMAVVNAVRLFLGMDALCDFYPSNSKSA